jgi:hypothetical protein
MRTALVAAAVVLFGAEVCAQPAAMTPLTTLTESASVVVVGDITASSSGTIDSSSIHIARILKGDPGVITLAFRWSRDLEDVSGTQVVHGLLFLVPGSPSGWVARPTVVGSPRLIEQLIQTPEGELPAGYSYSSESAPLDKVAAELLYTVDTVSDPEPLAVAYEALFSLNRAQDGVVRSHVAALTAADAESCPTVMALQTMGATLARAVITRNVQGLGVTPSLISLLCRTTDPGAVSSATALVNTAGVDPTIRRCAMRALRNTHSTPALPALAAALESPDMEIAYTGLMGLSAYATGELPSGPGQRTTLGAFNPVALAQTPSIPTFEANTASYLEYWRRWWRCEACTQQQPGCDPVACKGYIATYAAQYEANWTCTSTGATGCRKNLVTSAPSTYKPEPPDAMAPPPVVYTTGYVATYSAVYDANWTCAAGGATGCRRNRLSYNATSFAAVGPDASVPAAVLFTYAYVASWYTGDWSGCSASAWQHDWLVLPHRLSRQLEARCAGCFPAVRCGGVQLSVHLRLLPLRPL